MFFKTYICKPLQRPSVQGRHLNQVYEQNKLTGERKMLGPANRTKALNPNGESIPEIVQVARNRYDRTRYEAGLSKMIENPFRDDADNIMRQYGLKPEWQTIIEKIVTQEQIPLQTFAEIRFNLYPNELTEQVPTKPDKNNPDTRTRLMKKNVILYDRPNFFSEDNLEGFLAIHILLNNPDRVATNMSQANSAVHNWVILEEAVEQKLSADVHLKQNKAIGEYADYCLNYPITEALENNVVYFMTSIMMERVGSGTQPLVKGIVNAKTIDEKINNFLKPKDKADIEWNVPEFNRVVKLQKEQVDLFFTKYLVQQALNVQVIQPTNGYIYWKSQRDKLESAETYRFNSQETFTTFMYNEMTKVDSPIFDEFILELKSKNIIIPKQYKLKSVEA